MSEYQNGRFNGIIEGIEAHQSITNKMFSLEDMKNAFIEGVNQKYSERRISPEEFIQSLQQPIQLNVEPEMIEKYNRLDYDDNDGPTSVEPKITNNSILITKINNE